MQYAINRLVVDQYDMDLDKTASQPQGDSYALIVREGMAFHKKLPINNADEVRQSIDAFKKTAAELPDELVKVAREYLRLASRVYLNKDIFSEDPLRQPVRDGNLVDAQSINWDKYAHKMAKLQAVEPVFAFYDGDRGYYNITTRRDIEKGMDWFAKNAFRLEPEDRRVVAVNMSRRADELSVKKSEHLQKCASNEINPYAKMTLQARGFRVRYGNEKLAESYFDLAKKVADGEITDPMKLCLEITSLDKQAGYGKFKGLTDAYDTAFGLPQQAKKEHVKSAEIDVELAKRVLNEKGLNTKVENLTPLEKAALLK